MPNPYTGLNYKGPISAKPKPCEATQYPILPNLTWPKVIYKQTKTTNSPYLQFISNFVGEEFFTQLGTRETALKPPTCRTREERSSASLSRGWLRRSWFPSRTKYCAWPDSAATSSSWMLDPGTPARTRILMCIKSIATTLWNRRLKKRHVNSE